MAYAPSFHEDDSQDCAGSKTAVSRSLELRGQAVSTGIDRPNCPRARLEKYVSFLVERPRGRATSPAFVASPATVSRPPIWQRRLDQSGFEGHSEVPRDLSADDIISAKHRAIDFPHYDTHAGWPAGFATHRAPDDPQIAAARQTRSTTSPTRISSTARDRISYYDVMTDEDQISDARAHGR